MESPKYPLSVGTERDLLEQHLEFCRQTVIYKVTGISKENGIKRLGPTSTSVLGVLRHLTEVEYGWFHINFAGLQYTEGRYSEANPNGDIEIQVTGLRPGEKLYEELLIGDNPEPTQHARIMKAHEEFLSWPALQQHLAELMTAVDANNVPQMRELIQKLVPGYQPDGDVVDWVYLADTREINA